MGAYNPMSYHNGSVWPHDNALIVAGLVRYGFVSEAQQIATGLINAAKTFGGRLPELFCGFSTKEYPQPVPYPTSCSPQAWASATPLQLVRSLLRFEPDIPNGTLACAPVLPEALASVKINGIRVGHDLLSIDGREAHTTVNGLSPNLQLTGTA
jgi:glycogen debranching enzyme